MKYVEIMHAEMKPNIYGGENADEVEAQFECYAEGDKESETEDTITFDAKAFPPGTKIVVTVPECPKCELSVELCTQMGDCDFDWVEWRDGEFS